LLTANNNVISANDNDKSHVTAQPEQASDVTSSKMCQVAVPSGLIELKTFNHVQPVYYNQAQCVPLYGQYPGQYKHYRTAEPKLTWTHVPSTSLSKSLCFMFSMLPTIISMCLCYVFNVYFKYFMSHAVLWAFFTL